MPRRSAAPWPTTTASWPSSRESAMRVNAAGHPVGDGRGSARRSAGSRWRARPGSARGSPRRTGPPSRRRSARAGPCPASTGRPVSRASGAAVCWARVRSEEKIASGRSVGEAPGGLLGLRHAGLVEGDVRLPLEPVLDVPGRLAVPPQHEPLGCAQRASPLAVLPPRVADGGRLGQRDDRAVLPDALERVEDALLLVLDVDHDVVVVEQHPAALVLALAADQGGACLLELELYLVDDRADLPVVGPGAQQEHVGDRELVADVVGDDVSGQLLGRGERGDLGELDSPWGGSHVAGSASLVGDVTASSFSCLRKRVGTATMPA